jgi:hypothetical protein
VHVTGVQTCALPIYGGVPPGQHHEACTAGKSALGIAQVRGKISWPRAVSAVESSGYDLSKSTFV